jgi:DNA-directed RNA polymerase II subunit RPB11
MLRMQLLEDERVIFVGYRNPHPLEHHIVLRVQTTKGYSPKQALATAVDCLGSEFTAIMQGLEQRKQLLGGYG